MTNTIKGKTIEITRSASTNEGEVTNTMEGVIDIVGGTINATTQIIYEAMVAISRAIRGVGYAAGAVGHTA